MSFVRLTNSRGSLEQQIEVLDDAKGVPAKLKLSLGLCVHLEVQKGTFIDFGADINNRRAYIAVMEVAENDQLQEGKKLGAGLLINSQTSAKAAKQILEATGSEKLVPTGQTNEAFGHTWIELVGDSDTTTSKDSNAPTAEGVSENGATTSKRTKATAE